MKPIIEVRNVSKKYKIGQKQRYLSLRDSISHFFSSKDKMSGTSEFWALDDVSFDVHAGESIGIIGRNGAGKSTLLKILSRITPPTKGNIILRGRIASLLEVGTGFHPELSGRENVFMNGSILGLRRAEIAEKFDEIVAFSGVEQFIDTSLKHYSSGMQLRLAFAVAAHLEPEILVIDEVLAVGDAEFQKKCLGKMDDVSKSGRTVLFVSHNISMIQQLCSKGIWLNNGTISGMGIISHTIHQYLKSVRDNKSVFIKEESDKIIFLSSFKPINIDRHVTTNFLIEEIPTFEICIHAATYIKDALIGFILLDSSKRRIFTTEHKVFDKTMTNSSMICFTIQLSAHFLLPSDYSWEFAIHVPNQYVIDSADDICPFSIIDSGNELTKYNKIDNGLIFAPARWYRIK